MKEEMEKFAIYVKLRQANKNGHSARLMEVEDQVELANVAKENIQNLHEQVDGLQIAELVVRNVHAKGKEKASISPVDDLEVVELWGETKGSSFVSKRQDEKKAAKTSTKFVNFDSLVVTIR